MDLFSAPLMILYSVFYAVTMKVADFLNEHGMKWFKGSALLFGVLWGGFCVLLVLGHNILANLLLAMNLAFLLRNRLDFFNHRLAATMVVVAFLFSSTLEPALFTVFLIVFTLFGALKDYVDDVLKRRDWVYYLTESKAFYPVSTLVYCILYGNWIVFWAFFAFTLAYDLAKVAGKKWLKLKWA